MITLEKTSQGITFQPGNPCLLSLLPHPPRARPPLYTEAFTSGMVKDLRKAPHEPLLRHYLGRRSSGLRPL